MQLQRMLLALSSMWAMRRFGWLMQCQRDLSQSDDARVSGRWREEPERAALAGRSKWVFNRTR